MGGPLKEHMFAGHAVAGVAAAVVASTATHPLDTLKTLLQVSAGPTQKLGLSQVIECVKSASGIGGLYSGLGWSTLAKISGLGARFATYEVLTAFYKDGREDNHVYISEAMLAGITAGAIESVMRTPFELLKLRQQISLASSGTKSVGLTSSSPQSTPLVSKLLPGYHAHTKSWTETVELLNALSPKHRDLLGALRTHPWMLTGSGRPPLASEVRVPSRVFSLEGFGAFWRGIRPGMFRDCVFGGVFFSTWQFFHEIILTWKSMDIDPPPRSLDEAAPVSSLSSSLAAGFSGFLAAAASHTFDTAKVQSQCAVIPKYIMMERKLLRWKVPGVWIERVTGISPADRNFLFRGIWLRMARSGVASFTLVGSYFLAVDYLL